MFHRVEGNLQEEVRLAAESCQLNYWMALRTPLFFSREKTMLVTDVELSDFNGILRSQLPSSFASLKIARICDFFCQRGLPFSWHVPEAAAPTNLPRLLQEAGLYRGGQSWAAAIELEAPHSAAASLGASVRTVANYKEMELWLEFYTHMRKLEMRSSKRCKELFLKGGIEFPFRYFFLFKEGAIAAVATLVFFNNYAAVENFLAPAEFAPHLLGQLILHAKRMKRSHLLATIDEELVPLFAEERFQLLEPIEIFRFEP